MSFQAYLDNIEKQTGVAPEGFIKLSLLSFRFRFVHLLR